MYNLVYFVPELAKNAALQSFTLIMDFNQSSSHWPMLEYFRIVNYYSRGAMTRKLH